MKKLFILFVITIILLSCERENKDDNGSFKASSFENAVSIDEAEELIRGWIFTEYNPDMNPSFSFTLEEKTTDEIFSKLNSQIFFIVSDAPYLGKWALIKDKKVYDLLGFSYLSSTDFDNLTVTNLLEDSDFELCYTSHSGSGILYQGLNCFFFKNDSPVNKFVPLFRFPLDYSIYLKKESYSKLKINYKDKKYDVIIGEVKLKEIGEEINISADLNEDLPSDIIDNINGNR